MFPAFALRPSVDERKAVNGDDTNSLEVIVEIHILHVGEFLQSKDNGIKRDEEERLIRWRVQLWVGETNSISTTTLRVRW